MPTLLGADNFLHRSFNTFTLPATTTKRIWSLESNPGQFSFDTGKARDGRGFLKCIEDGATQTNLAKAIPAGNRVLVGSCYVIVDTAPGTGSDFLTFAGTVSSKIGMNTDGTVRAQCGAGTTQSGAVNIADGAAHRIDWKLDTSAATYTLDVSVDGTALTQATVSSTATDIAVFRVGSTVAAHNLTFWMQDVVWGVTSGDHPIGAHRVHSLNPNADGTHNVSVDGDMLYDSGAGENPINGATTSWEAIDDWLTGAADTTTYIEDTAGASTEYSEHEFEDTAESTVWGAFGYAACFASAATACRLGITFVNSAGTGLADILADEDVSETTLRYWFGKVDDNPAASAVNGFKVRIGLSGDVAPDPRCSAVMLMVAVPDDPAAPPATTYPGWEGGGWW